MERGMSQIDFWYSIGSTYSYLTVMRLPEVERAAGIKVRWRPFDVRHVMVEQNNIPFKDKPMKTAYMWRDLERRAGRYGLAPRVPAPYPLPGLVLANQIATLGAEEGWVAEYTRATYRRWLKRRASRRGTEHLRKPERNRLRSKPGTSRCSVRGDQRRT